MTVEREYKELLQSTLKEKRLRVERLSDFLSDNNNMPSSRQASSMFPPYSLSPLAHKTMAGAPRMFTVSSFQSMEPETSRDDESPP